MRLSRILAIAATVFSLSASAGALLPNPEPIAEGFDYIRLKDPQPVSTGKKIEVLEVFWYQCPHCWQLEPELELWAKALPADVQLRKLPAVMSERWIPAAKLYFALNELRLTGKLHGKVFDAYHVQKLDLNKPEVLGAWVERQGVPRAKLERSMNSFSVAASVKHAEKQVAAYQLEGVPAIVVDGKYVTSPSIAGSRARMFEVVDQLVAKARKGRKTRN